MTLLADYTAGTISVSANGTVVTGVGTAWKTAGFKEGDWFIANGWVNVVASVDAETQLTLAQQWQGGALDDEPYRLRYMSDGSRTSAQARQLIDMLGGSGNLEALGGLAGVAGYVPVFTGPGTMGLLSQADITQGVRYDAQVDTLAERDAYDAQPEGFAVLVNNTGDGRSAVYSRIGAAGNWTGPAYITGPAVTLDVTEVDEVPYGDPPDVTLTPVAGGYNLAFEIPKGMIIEPGTTTTLGPGASATVDFVPVAGGYRLDIGLPKGDTGDIDGVTPFWVTRLSSDNDAASARTGLGVDRLPHITLLDNNDDFDTLITPGWHDRMVVGTQPNGYGGGNYGYLLVLGYSTSRTQIVFPYRDADGPIRYRSLYNDVWGDWRSTWDTENLKEITKAEAEAGTATTPRAWSALRVSQAIAASVPEMPTDVYKRSNILGTVSQSGGIPTGAIIERGSNANGEYVRFADGTQICTLLVVLGSGPSTVTLPAPFVDDNYAISSINRGSSQSSAVSYKYQSLSLASFNLLGINITSAGISAAGGTTLCIAIGRWF